MVKWNKKNTALALDLDPQPLRYGKKNHFSYFFRSEKKAQDIEKKCDFSHHPKS